MNEKYKKIIDMPAPRSEKHPQMSLHDRAAQFAPFAALTGYGDAVDETARLTETGYILSDEENSILNERLKFLREHINERPRITVQHFVPDKRKHGGSFEYYTGNLRRIDEIIRKFYFTDGSELCLDGIYKIEITEE